MINAPLFDRICNIRLITENGESDYITTPDSGYKPDIQVSGTFIPSPMAKDISIRIANFYPERDLRDYKSIEITLGYKDSSLQEIITGQVWIAYKESPGPDGITYFQILLGAFSKFINQKFQKKYDKDTPITAILTDIGNEIGLPFDQNTFLKSTDVIENDMYFNGFVKDALLEIQYYVQQKFRGFVVSMEDKQLTCFSIKNGVKKTWNIDYFSSVPRREAWGWTFVAPWNPGIRPGHYVSINSEYAKQTYSTFINRQLTESRSVNMLVQSVSFDFRTTGNTNQMTCVVLDQYDQDKV